MDLYFYITPSDGYRNVFFSNPIFGQSVMFLYHLDQELRVIFYNILNSKVINYQRKYILGKRRASRKRECVLFDGSHACATVLPKDDVQ